MGKSVRKIMQDLAEKRKKRNIELLASLENARLERRKRQQILNKELTGNLRGKAKKKETG